MRSAGFLSVVCTSHASIHVFCVFAHRAKIIVTRFDVQQFTLLDDDGDDDDSSSSLNLPEEVFRGAEGPIIVPHNLSVNTNNLINCNSLRSLAREV